MSTNRDQAKPYPVEVATNIAVNLVILWKLSLPKVRNNKNPDELALHPGPIII